MTNEIVERMARAIAESDGSCWDGLIGGRKVSRDNYRSLARAALEGAREPTEAMKAAYFELSPINDDEPFNGPNPDAIWHAMIDAALA